jgi:hypothetical protein
MFVCTRSERHHPLLQLTIGLAAELGNQTVLDEMARMMAYRDIQNQMGPDGSLPFEVHFFTSHL